ncbi:MAG: cell envelope integrity protein CreD [Bacteroidetes bacterium]|nr:cell envelope integrity protein CreD [Bacteroidota bacterium]
MTTENTLIEKVNNWMKNSVTLKLVIITILMLLLLIPTLMIKDIINEREELSNQAIEEVSSKWAERQQINGPILTIPLIYEYDINNKIVTTIKYWHLLPENLKIDGKIEPEKLRRGIYEVVVYKSNLSVKGNFDLVQQPDRANLKEIKYDQSFLTIGISDLRGIKNQINFKWDKQNLSVKPGSKISSLAYSGVTVDLPNIQDKIGKKVNFEFLLNLRGSQNISFVPVGSTTEVNLSSGWESPSFNGNFLPDTREINSDGFKANWLILQLNRNFPQSWIETDQSTKMKEAAFGVDLIIPLDDYQKSMRSAKYAVMTIALTFLVFFLVEILNKRKIHPFQYILVGLALCLFYILLVSITEHSNFNFAYGISTLGIVSMVTLYSLSIFKAKKLTILLTSTLVGIYGFLFVTFQLSDYALLMGSIGLTLILGATMYFTRKINWYKLNIETE